MIADALIYLSSSWKNRERVRAMALALRNLGWVNVYDFTDPACRGAPEIPPEKFPEEFDPERHAYSEYLRGEPHWRAAVEGNRRALIDAEYVVLLLPCGNDAHADWAYATALGATSIVTGHPGKGQRTPSHLWANYILGSDLDVLAFFKRLIEGPRG